MLAEVQTEGAGDKACDSFWILGLSTDFKKSLKSILVPVPLKELRIHRGC